MNEKGGSREGAKRTTISTGKLEKLYLPIPLQPSHIRLLRIPPRSTPDEVLIVELYVASLDSQESFTYLSYKWGQTASEHPIVCNGVSLLTTRNLHQCLRQLRRRQWTQPLWIDAICINQDDEDEKAYQVSLISEITSRASTTILWLGYGDHNTELLFQHCLVGRHLPEASSSLWQRIGSGLSILVEHYVSKR